MTTAQQTTSVWEQEILDAIGEEATLKLEKAFGASYLYIGAKTPSKTIVNAIGIEAGMKLVNFFGCGDIWVPRCLLIKTRDNAIVDGINTGKTIIELAAKFKMKTPNIRRILRGRNIHA